MERVDADLVPFAQNNPSGYRFAFGTDTATDDINVNYNDNIKKGWGTTPNEFPEVEDFNAMVYTIGYLLSYLYHMGIAEWNDKQKYRQYSRVIGSDGIIYKAKTGTTGIPNVGNNPTTDSVNWQVENITDYSSLTNKTTPIDADLIAIADSTSSFSLKKLSWTNIKATLKTYFDTLYNLYNPTPTIATGTATFTATTNNINLTGIGIGVEVGDVIQISGAIDAKNNSEFTVEVITDANNIIVNQAHANKGTTKNVAAQAGDAGVTVKLLAKWYNAPAGLGQDWVNVAANRALATNYANNTNRATLISVVFTSTASTTASHVYINGTLYGGGSQSSLANYSVYSFFAVPKDNRYSVISSSGGTVNIAIWSELR